MAGEPIPLFLDEVIRGSVPASYILPEDLAWPISWPGLDRALGALRRFPLVDIWNPQGSLVLTSYRLMFIADPQQGLPLRGRISLFLPRLTHESRDYGMNTHSLRDVEFRHEGGYGRSAHRFRITEKLLWDMHAICHEAQKTPREDWEAFATALEERWWRAGLGLLSGPTRELLPAWLWSDEDGSGYRTAGEDTPSFAELRSRLGGIEGMGLEQLCWLLDEACAPDADSHQRFGRPRRCA